ncbi:cell division protein FtsL [Scopulibacillus cellulosilyticus]|uniref:Cell division protein FtsL n=1 Tax=Scopulibacillus cellulosilyticus TaxID=2665665 RepID=A0ABW2PTG1_9BACL
MNQAARNLNQTDHVVQRERNDQQSVQRVSDKRKITKGEKCLWTMAAFLIFALAITIVSNQAKLYTTTRAASDLQGKIDQQSKINNQLKEQVSQLSSPERIMAYAKDKLGLKLNIKNVKVLP